MIDLDSLFGSTALTRAFLLTYRASSTYIAPFDQTVVVHAIGAGGSGAHSTSGKATGGGGGAYLKKKINLKAGDVLTITIGAGGQSRVGSGSGPTAPNNDGYDGGDTIILLNGVEIARAGGGKGGKRSSTVQPATTPLPGGAGGIATGGDINRPGGRGGNITLSGTNSSGAYSTGGGGVDIVGLGADAGDLLNVNIGNTNSSAYVYGTAGGGPAGPVILNGAGAGIDPRDVPLAPRAVGIPATPGAVITEADMQPLGTPILIWSRIGPLYTTNSSGGGQNNQAGPLIGGRPDTNTSTSDTRTVNGKIGGELGGGGSASNNANGGTYSGGSQLGGGSGALINIAGNTSTTTGSGGPGAAFIEVMAA